MSIIDKIENNPIYHRIFMYKKKYKNFIIQNVKWDCNKIYEVCLQDRESKNRMCLLPDEDDYEHLQLIESIKTLLSNFMILPTFSFTGMKSSKFLPKDNIYIFINILFSYIKILLFIL